MRIDELQPRHPAGAEPRAQLVDEVGQTALLLAFPGLFERPLRGGERLGDEARQAHHIDAIAGVELVLARRVEAFAKQPRDRRGIVERPAGAHGDAAHRAIDAKEARFEPARALGLTLEQDREVPRQPGDRPLDILASADRTGEAPFGGKVRRGEARRNGAALPSAKRIETAHHLGAEARGDRRTRAQRDVADAAQAGAGQIGDGFFVEAERGERQVMEDFGEGPLRQARRGDPPVGKPRQRPGCARRVGDAQSDLETLGGEARCDLVGHFRFVAEQMGDAGNVEHEPVLAIERDKRGEARAPVGEAAKQPRLFFRRGFDGDEIGAARARVGERQAGREAEAGGQPIDADELLRALDFGDGDERRGFSAGAGLSRAPRSRPIGRQTREPQGEKSSGHRNTFHRHAIRGG